MTEVLQVSQDKPLEHHYVSDLVAGTKKITTSLYGQAGLSFPTLEAKVKKLDGLSEPYITRATNVIDQGLDNAIRTSSNLLKLTKKQLSKFSSDEKLLFELVRTWIITIWQRGFSQGFSISLPDFLNAINEDTGFRGQIDKIREKVAVFHKVATNAWSKLLEKNKKDLKRVILEITASSLSIFSGVPSEQEAFVQELVNSGEELLDENRGERTVTVAEFIEKLKALLVGKFPADTVAGEEAIKKFYNVIQQYHKVLSASEGLSEYMVLVSSSRWAKYVVTGSDVLLTGFEDVINKLHRKFVVAPSKRILKEEEHRPTDDIVAISPPTMATYKGRAKNVLAKLNDIRLALLEQLPRPQLLLAKEAMRVWKNLNQFLVVLTNAGTKAIERLYTPVQTYSIQFLARPEVVKVRVYVAGKVQAAVKALEANPTFQKYKEELVVLYKKESIQLRIKYSRAKIYSMELKNDIQQFVYQLYQIMREQEDQHKIPTKVYNLALEAYKKRQARASTAAVKDKRSE